MLVVTIGASVMVYQLGVLEGLGLQALAPSGERQALFWLSPTITLAILVGLGLDYDIFLMDSVMEHWQEGKDARSAVIAALDQAGTIISAAGIIMFLAFSAMLASTTPMLNQVGFMLCVGVLLDCFVTTKARASPRGAWEETGRSPGGGREVAERWPRDGPRGPEVSREVAERGLRGGREGAERWPNQSSSLRDWSPV